MNKRLLIIIIVLVLILGGATFLAFKNYDSIDDIFRVNNDAVDENDYLSDQEKEDLDIRSEIKTVAIKRNEQGRVIVYEMMPTDEQADSDGDGLFDYEETNLGTSIDNVDTDDDGIGDYEEVQNGLDPLVYDECDRSIDSDGDGLNDCREYLDTKTDKNNVDTDGDGVEDGVEVRLSYDPNKFDDFKDMDSYGDSLTDYDEIFVYKTNPRYVNTDGDSLYDNEDVEYGFDPLVADVNRVSDSDSDGLTDFEEVNTYHTHPKISDTDGDGFSDGDEVTSGYNPNGEGELE